MNLFRIRGIQLAVHFSFLLLLAYYAQEGWEAAGATGLVWNVWTLLAFFACVVLHELGHSFTAMHYGINVRRILLMPIGGMAEMDDIPRQPVRELLITLAGPAVNFVIAGALWLVLRNSDYLSDDNAGAYSLPGLAQTLLVANLVMGCFNLVPAYPMDGGRILRALLAMRLPYLRATFWAATVGKLLAVIGIAIALWFGRYLNAALFAFIFYVGEMEYRAIKRREQDDAHWRVTLARLYAERAAQAEEPPLLTRKPD